MISLTAGPRPLFCECTTCGYRAFAQRVETIEAVLEEHTTYCAVRQVRADVDRERASAVAGTSHQGGLVVDQSVQFRTVAVSTGRG